MKGNFLVLVSILAVIQSFYAAKYKCGYQAQKCQLLSNGKVFWPKDYNKTCSLAPVCPPSYKLYKIKIGDLKACCCLYKKYKEDCPDCIMNLNLNFTQWIDYHLSSNFSSNPEGTCSNGKVKRLFIPNEAGKEEKCCCEPRNSGYIFASE